MQLAQRLAEYISACFTGLWIESHEHDDALREIAQLCREQNWRLATWDIEQGLRIPGQNNGQPPTPGAATRWPPSARSTPWPAPTVRQCWF